MGLVLGPEYLIIHSKFPLFLIPLSNGTYHYGTTLKSWALRRHYYLPIEKSSFYSNCLNIDLSNWEYSPTEKKTLVESGIVFTKEPEQILQNTITRRVWELNPLYFCFISAPPSQTSISQPMSLQKQSFWNFWSGQCSSCWKAYFGDCPYSLPLLSKTLDRSTPNHFHNAGTPRLLPTFFFPACDPPLHSGYILDPRIQPSRQYRLPDHYTLCLHNVFSSASLTFPLLVLGNECIFPTRNHFLYSLHSYTQSKLSFKSLRAPNSTVPKASFTFLSYCSPSFSKYLSLTSFFSSDTPP